MCSCLEARVRSPALISPISGIPGGVRWLRGDHLDRIERRVQSVYQSPIWGSLGLPGSLRLTPSATFAQKSLPILTFFSLLFLSPSGKHAPTECHRSSFAVFATPKSMAHEQSANLDTRVHCLEKRIYYRESTFK